MKEKINVGVIAAAGKGTRAYPRTDYIPKPLFVIEGKSILQRNVELLISVFEVKEIYILVGHLKEKVISEIKRIQQNISIPLKIKPWTKEGLASDIASLESFIKENFIVILGDEFYQKSAHKEFLFTLEKFPSLTASIGITKTLFLSAIKKNYSVKLENEKVIELIEKPNKPINQILGLGSYLFTPKYFEFYKKTSKSLKSNIIEITDVIDKMAKDTGQVFVSDIKASYININSMQDYHFATYQLRSEKFDTFKKTAIFISDQDLNSVKEVTSSFENFVDEIIIFTNQADRSSLESSKVKVYFLEEVKNGITCELIKKAAISSSGDILTFISGEGCFRSKDFAKFLEYMKDSDMVIGTRTTRQMIEQGSNLGSFDRFFNLVLGKLIELFWWKLETRLTDANCFYFTIWKDSFKKIESNLKLETKEFIAEIMIETIKNYLRCIEIPVSFYKSISEKKVTKLQTMKNFIRIFFMILKKKFS